MKILLLAIVSSIGIGVGIADLMIFGNISPALSPSHDWNSGTLIDTPGLNNTYQVGDTAKFSILIHGFTNHRCATPAIMLYADRQPDRPILNYSVSLMSCPINDTSSYTLYLPSKSDNFLTTFERPGPYTLDILFDKNESIQTHFLVTGPKITHYYDGSAIKPKVELYDYYYNGIDKDNATVSINNQTYYQTTLNYADYDLKKGTSIQFQNVTFAFPEGVMTTPGGAFIMLDVKFQDNSEEIYGENKKNPDGSGSLGGIGIPTQYGPHLSTNSTTVLGNHVMPQAGMTIYNDKIKLLVSIPQLSQQLATTCTAGPGMSCNNQPVTMSRNNGTNPLGIVSLVIYTPPDSCLGLSCPPYTFYLKINSKFTAYLLGYDICGNDLCVKNDTLSILLPISNTQTANYTFIGISENKKWNYGDTADIKLKVSPTPNPKDAYFQYMKNSAIVP